MKIDLTPALPTIIGRFRIPDAEAMNEELRALILAAEAEYPTLGRSNIGGWHSSPDLLKRPEAGLKAWVRWGLHQMIDATAGANAFRGVVNIAAWATICRAGAYHAPHSHPDSAWSGVYYVDAGCDIPSVGAVGRNSSGVASARPASFP